MGVWRHGELQLRFWPGLRALLLGLVILSGLVAASGSARAQDDGQTCTGDLATLRAEIDARRQRLAQSCAPAVELMQSLLPIQSKLLRQADKLLNVGGELIYCTCSLLPDEGEVQIEEALGRHADMQVERAALDIDGVDPDWVTSEGGLRLRPDYWAAQGGMDGFYMACLRKMGG